MAKIEIDKLYKEDKSGVSFGELDLKFQDDEEIYGPRERVQDYV